MRANQSDEDQYADRFRHNYSHVSRAVTFRDGLTDDGPSHHVRGEPASPRVELFTPTEVTTVVIRGGIDDENRSFRLAHWRR